MKESSDYEMLEQVVDKVARVRGAKYPHLKDDARQEAWVHALEAMETYDRRRGPQRPYLRYVTDLHTRRAIFALAKPVSGPASHPELLYDCRHEELTDHMDPVTAETVLWWRQLREAVGAVLSEADTSGVAERSLLDGEPWDGIAESTGISRDEIRSRDMRARLRLRVDKRIRELIRPE